MPDHAGDSADRRSPQPSETLTGWGRLEPARADVVAPDTPAQVAGVLRSAPQRGVIARGLGRSYNNAAQNDRGLVIMTSSLNRISDLDADSGHVTCEAGVSLEQLMIAGLPHRWFVPVSPGTRQVTIGGAIAAYPPCHNHHAAVRLSPPPPPSSPPL